MALTQFAVTIMCQKLIVYGCSIFFSETLYRLIVQFRKEVLNHDHHHESGMRNIFNKTMDLNILAKISGSMLTAAAIVMSIYDPLFKHTFWSLDVGCVVATYFMARLMNLSHNTLDEMYFIRNGRGLDYGSGMALSYFYGYLNIVLPSTGECQSKDLQERIIDYEAKEGVNFPIKKLFILVPDSMFTANKLDGDNLETRRNLETIKCNRSGIQKRTYHNSVYKITNTDWYVTVEGASPLQTYYEAMRSEPRLKLFRKEIAIAFYNTLKEALWEERQTRDLYEVIHIRDNDEDIKPDYGLILKEWIENHIKRREEKAGKIN